MKNRPEHTPIIVLTGPESCGKTRLCRQLADAYQTQWVPEFARGYVENLDRPYEFSDVVKIAHRQLEQYNEALQSGCSIVFLDTFLIITKVWFDLVYQQCPAWLSDAIGLYRPDLYLLCTPDLPWQADTVRENGHIRQELFELYRKELDYYELNYQIIEGIGKERLTLAEQYINQHLQKPDYDRINRINRQKGH